MKTALLGKVRPAVGDVGVNTLRELRSGAVLLKTRNEADMKQIVESEQFKVAGHRAEQQKEFRPKLIIHYTESSMSDAEFLGEVYDDNLMYGDNERELAARVNPWLGR